MALTISQFIGRGQNGQPIALFSSVSSNEVHIGGQVITIPTSPVYDLGVYHTAENVLESYDVRAGIVSGQILATIGLVSLSLTPIT